MPARRPLLLIATLLAGCAAAPVDVDRAKLGRPEMAWEPDPLLATYRDQAHASKEQASGNATAGGGGCGCNN